MRRNQLILRQHPIRRSPKRRFLYFRSGITKDMIRSEVRRNAIAFLPMGDLGTCGEDLSCEIGTGDYVGFCSWVLAPYDYEVAVL